MKANVPESRGTNKGRLRVQDGVERPYRGLLDQQRGAIEGAAIVCIVGNPSPFSGDSLIGKQRND